MKWFFLVNNAPRFGELLGKIAHQAVREGDECVVTVNSKLAEFEKRELFPQSASWVSKVDWCAAHYQEQQENFGDLSWKEFFSAFDRWNNTVNFSYEEAVRIASQLYQFFDYLFEKEKPDVVLSEPPAGIHQEIAYQLCRKYQIPYFGLMVSRIPERFDVYDLVHTDSRYEKTFQELRDEKITGEEQTFARQFLDEFVFHKNVPLSITLHKIRLSQSGILKHYLKRIPEVGRPQLTYISRRQDWKRFDYESEILIRQSVKALFRLEARQIRLFLQKHIFDKISEEALYFLFPLHLHPEASISVRARYYADQVSTIRNIAFTLPFPYQLYVKEHPTAFGTRSASFYREIKKIPQVVLVSPYEDVPSLIKNSAGVITLTSTMGMEAALSGKPTYVLGDVFYSYHPLCRKVQNFEDLQKKIRLDITEKPSVVDLANINMRFVVSYFRNTIKGTPITTKDGLDTNDYKLFYDSLKSRV